MVFRVWNKPNKKLIDNASVVLFFFELPHFVPSMAVDLSKKENYLKKLGAHIAKLRQKQALSQAELGFRCDKDKQSIQRLEKGRMNPTAYYLSEIAEGLDIDPKELLNFKK